MLLARLAACWLVGVAVADALWPPTGPPPASAGPVVAGLCAVALAAAWRWRAEPAGVALLGAACLLAGAGRVWAGRPRFAPGDIARWRDGGTVTVEGRVASEPERRDGGVHYRLAVAAVDGAPAHGRLLVQAARFPVHAYGDRLRVRGEVVTPPTLPDFDYRAYLARAGVHALVRRAHVARLDGPPGGAAVVRGLIALRARGRRVLDHALPEPEAALATGVLLGDDNGLPRAVADAFQRTNTTHVIAISGANIALLVGVLQLALRRWRRRRLAAAATIGVVAAYTLLVGADPAVVRAAIMGALSVFAVSVDRRAEAVTALGLAGVGMTAWRPAVIGDLGFQLSFAATAGLIAFAGRLAAAVDALAARRGGGVVAGAAVRDVLNAAVLVTLAAQLTTWPIVARHTGQLAAAGLAANALIVPVQPAVMGLGAATIAAGLVAPPLGRAAGAVAWLPLAWTVRVVEAFAGLPASSLGWRPPIAVVAGYYAALLAVALPDARRAALALVRDGVRRVGDAVRPHGARRDPARWAALALAAAAAALAWRGALAQPDGLLHVVALDVGQGDAILVVAPNGRRMLVDGGPSPSAVLDGLGRRFAPWDRRLDVVVLTHPDADHVGGLPAVLGRYRVAHIVQPDVAHDTPDARAWAAAVTAEGAAVWSARRGLRLTLDGAAGVAAEVRWPPPGDLAAAIGAPEPATNDHSVVLTIGYGAARVLLTGDIEAGVERALVRSGLDLRADVLKVAHHGSATSSGAAILAAVAPRLAVISVGADNRFGHPDPGVLDRLGAVAVRRTDVDGAVDVVLDGRDVWVR